MNATGVLAASAGSDYGLWLLVIVSSAVLIIFTASFFHPRSGRDWKAMGGFSAFVVALMVEMYGFPFTIYLLSGWLAAASLPSPSPTRAATCGASSSDGRATRT